MYYNNIAQALREEAKPLNLESDLQNQKKDGAINIL
jgi:hypothetical protein